jgi:hypothetical protein
VRTAGVIGVALGIVLLVTSALLLVLAETLVQLVVSLGCAGFVALPLVLAGIVLTRRAAARSGPDGEAESSAASLRRATKVLETLGGGPVGKADPDGSAMERFRAFDLNTLTAAGWLLVLATGGFLFTEAVLFHRLVLRDRQGDVGPVAGLAFLGGFLLAAAFFYAGWRLLKALGVPLTK